MLQKRHYPLSRCKSCVKLSHGLALSADSIVFSDKCSAIAHNSSHRDPGRSCHRPALAHAIAFTTSFASKCLDSPETGRIFGLAHIVRVPRTDLPLHSFDAIASSFTAKVARRWLPKSTSIKPYQPSQHYLSSEFLSNFATIYCYIAHEQAKSLVTDSAALVATDPEA